jgi:hypothetical protein
MTSQVAKKVSERKRNLLQFRSLAAENAELRRIIEALIPALQQDLENIRDQLIGQGFRLEVLAYSLREETCRRRWYQRWVPWFAHRAEARLDGYTAAVRNARLKRRVGESIETWARCIQAHMETIGRSVEQGLRQLALEDPIREIG